MRHRKRLGLILVGASAVVFLCMKGERATPAPGTGGMLGERPQPSFLGVPSCSARSCHGGDIPVPTGRLLRNEYTTWIERDPHAVAYSILFGSRSADIMKNLANPGSEPGLAHTDVRCLACHCEPHVGSQTALARQRIDGVGCEACHGAAAKWIDPHTASALWDKLTAAEKQQAGMTNVKDPAAMAQRCADCHVGAPADANDGTPVRDVNHEILAAGHPRLNFEFATFMANLPAHWKQLEEGDDAQRRNGARPWAIGQIAASRAALRLLADRARRAEAAGSQGGWPEFAEYDCASCHHALSASATRQRRPQSSGLLGQSSWNTWYLSVPSRVLAEGAAETTAFTDLARHLQRPYPALQAIPKLNNAAQAALSRMEARLGGMSDQKLAALARDRLRKLQPGDRSCWELAEQVSLSTALLDRANLPKAIAADPERPPTPVEKVFDRLAFPKGMDGQGGFYWDESFERDLKAIMNSDALPK